MITRMPGVCLMMHCCIRKPCAKALWQALGYPEKSVVHCPSFVSFNLCLYFSMEPASSPRAVSCCVRQFVIFSIKNLLDCSEEQGIGWFMVQPWEAMIKFFHRRSIEYQSSRLSYPMLGNPCGNSTMRRGTQWSTIMVLSQTRPQLGSASVQGGVVSGAQGHVRALLIAVTQEVGLLLNMWEGRGEPDAILQPVISVNSYKGH